MAHKIVQNSEITASSNATVELNCNANQFNHSFYYCSLKILWKNHLGMWLIYLTEIGSYRKGVVLPVAMRRRSQPQMICGRLVCPLHRQFCQSLKIMPHFFCGVLSCETRSIKECLQSLNKWHLCLMSLALGVENIHVEWIGWESVSRTPDTMKVIVTKKLRSFFDELSHEEVQRKLISNIWSFFWLFGVLPSRSFHCGVISVCWLAYIKRNRN